MKMNHRHIEILSIPSFLGILFYFLSIQFKILIFQFNLDYLLLTLSSFLFSYLLADFISGFVHFIGDTFGTETTPIFGKSFIQPFREHHVDPKAMTKHDFVETNGNNCIVSLPAMLLVYLFVNPEIDSLEYFLFSSFSFLMGFIFITNQIHKWAHLDSLPNWIRFLQNYRLILSPSHHSIHHASPYDKYFCITTGWLNPLLTQIRFFELIKKIFRKQNSQLTETLSQMEN
jgi:hypothetical protein